MENTKYRIVKITTDSGKAYYVIQKYKRILGIGPKTWQYYEDVYDGNHCSHDGWTHFISCAEKYNSIESVREELDNIIKRSKQDKIMIKETIKNYDV